MILAFLLISLAHAEPSALRLEDYLAQVGAQNPSVSAARLHGEGGISRAEGAAVPTYPYLFGNLNALDDKSLGTYPSFQGTETKANAYTLGVGVNTPYGLGAKYSWNSGWSNTLGVTFPTVGDYTSYNKIDLNLNLVHNGFGSEITARQSFARAASLAQSLSGNYQLVTTLTQAESTYWRLAFARQAVQVQKDVLDRDAKLLEWAKRRVGLQLGDRSDLLQAQALYGLHRVDLASAIEEERAASRAFNQQRNEPGNTVPESLPVPNAADTLRAPTPARAGQRLDVQASAERAKAGQAQTQLDKELLKPNVDLIASYAWTGRDTTRGTAVSDAFGNLHPMKSVGLSFSVPLDVPVWKKAIEGANQESEAIRFDLEQTKLTEARDWSDLSDHLAQARARLELLGSLEGVQKDKYENERQRLLRGRTTTLQTVIFEQDYATTQLQRLRTQADVLQTIAQMKAFREKP